MAYGKLKVDSIETSTQVINIDDLTLVSPDDITQIVNRLDRLRHENCIYVSLNGSDLNSGKVDSPLRTLRAAASIAQPGDVVYVAAGTYIETTLPIRWKYDVTVFGAGLRSTIVQPAPGQEFNDVFKVDSGFWCWGISFAGHQADETFQSWAISFDELADNRFRGAVGLGAFILKSPYIQNCTSITAEDDSGLAGSQSTGNTGGGIKVDGDQCAINSPIRSMVVDSYTQVNLGGPGCLVTNDGYAQLVSFFGTFCTYHVRTETGGQVNLSGGGTTDFGVYGLMADGYSKTPLYTGSARTEAYGAMRLERSVTINTSTDTFSSPSHTLVENDQITFKATQGLLPTGLEPNTIYYVISSGLTENEFRVSETLGGLPVDISGDVPGTYLFERLGATEIDVVDFSPNRLGRKIKYPTSGSLGSTGNPVLIQSVNGNFFTITLDTSTIKHEYLGGGTVNFAGTNYTVTSAVYNETTGVTTISADGFTPVVGVPVTLNGLAFICNSASRPNAGQLMFPQLVFPRNAITEEAEAKTFPYTRTGNYTLTYTEAASPNGPEHVYVSGGTAIIGGMDYGVSTAEYNKDTGVVTLTTLFPLPPGDGDVLVDGLQFICPSSAYIVTSSVPIDANGNEVENTSLDRAGYRVIFYSGLNGGLKNPLKPGQKLDFRSRSQISAPSHTFEFVGSGTNYDALPWNGGVPVPANAIVETNNGKVYSSNTNEKGDFAVGSQFSVDGTTGSVTISTDQFNLSGLNFIGPFSRNGGFSTVGEQLREVSNNTSLIASTGAPDSNTAPTQFAVKSYSDNKFLTDVTVSSGLPISVSDTSTVNSQGYWTRTREIALSVNEPGGLARLDGSGLIPSSLLPSYVDDVLEFPSLASFPDQGETGKIYVALDTSRAFRWSGTTYIEVSPPPTSTDTVPEGITNLYFTQSRARQSLSVSNNNGLTYDSGTGVFSFTLPNTGVAAGNYTYSSITVDEKGRITSAQSGTNPVTSVGLSVPTGFEVTNSPVTGTGDLTFTFATGYSLPTVTSQSNWDTAYNERLYWDGGATGLNAATGRTSLGLATVAATGAYSDLSGTPTIPAAADATPQPLGTAAIGVSTDYAREDHVHVMPSAADVGADPAGAAASGIAAHIAAADPHPNYALESSLATVATTGSYTDLANKPVIPSGADALPQNLGVATIGISADYAREDHVHAMPSAGDVGADPAGTSASGITAHEAAADPHPNYALESSLAAVASTGAYSDLTGTPVIPSGADATPLSLGVAAVGVSADYAREDHVHAMPSAGDVGADPAGTSASGIAAHEAAADPHPSYALESSLGGAALLNVGTTAGTVAAGDDIRFTTDLSYTVGTRVLASSTGADVTLPLFTSIDAGLVPGSGGGTANFLRADGIWASPTASGSSVTVSANPPTSPIAGDLWYDSDSAALYVYYNDGNTSQWVSTSVGGGGTTDPQNLSELLDVDFGGTTPADKAVLTYSSGLGIWQPQAPAQYYASFRPSTSTQTVGTNQITIDFDEIVVRSDTWPLETVSPNGYIYVPTTGKYLVTVSIYVDTTSTPTRNALETSLYSSANGFVNRAMSYAYSPNNSYYYASTHMSAIISATNTASWVCYAGAGFNYTAGSTTGNVSQDSRLNIVYLGE